jgi:hypothetical protein
MTLHTIDAAKSESRRRAFRFNYSCTGPKHRAATPAISAPNRDVSSAEASFRSPVAASPDASPFRGSRDAKRKLIKALRAESERDEAAEEFREPD